MTVQYRKTIDLYYKCYLVQVLAHFRSGSTWSLVCVCPTVYSYKYRSLSLRSVRNESLQSIYLVCTEYNVL